MTIGRDYAETLDECLLPFNFNNLCDRGKEIIISYSFHYNEIYDYSDYFEILDYISSPIEQIFYVAFILYCKSIRIGKIDGIPLSLLLLDNIKTQYKIQFRDKIYNIDFSIDFSEKNDKGEYLYPKIKDLKYAIELDGFDYHSNKKQMNYDYERENNLKFDGYNVIRFTGSQVYKEPFVCVHKLIAIIVNDILKEKNGK